MIQATGIARLLPEEALTLAGIAIMLIEPLMPRGASRRPMGWLAVLGSLAALAASIWQGSLVPGSAYMDLVQTDAYSVFFHILICSIVLVSLLVALGSFPADARDTGAYYILMLFGAMGMCLMTCATELLLVFIGLEISSISTYVLVAFRKHDGKSTEAGLKYFLLGSFATAFFLYGIALTFGATGTTRIADIAPRLAQSPTPALGMIALAMLLIGLGFKVSAAPFQVWTPDVYEGAPSPVVGLISTAPKAAAFAVLLRLTYSAYPRLHGQWFLLIWLMSAASMLIGNLGALRQQNVKRMLAYSSIAHGGYLLAAFTALSPDGIAAAMFYAAAYAATNVGIFAVLSHAGGYDDRRRTISDYRGLGHRAPLLGGAMAFFLLSLIGIPFTGGFFGKFYIFSATLHANVTWLTVIGLLNSGLAGFYYLRLLISLYGKPEADAMAEPQPRLRGSLAFALLLTISATLILGIFPGRILTAAGAGAATYAGSNPSPGLARNQAPNTARMQPGR